MRDDLMAFDQAERLVLAQTYIFIERERRGGGQIADEDLQEAVRQYRTSELDGQQMLDVLRASVR